MPRSALIGIYALLVVIWSSTWVAIKLGLEDTPPLLGAGIRFVFAGALLLVIAQLRHGTTTTDRRLALILGALPFAGTYGLIYWGEQYIPSGLTAVLFGCLPLYVALLAAATLADEPLTRRLGLGLGLAIAGLILAFGESISLGDEERAVAGAIAVLLSPLCAAVGNVEIKRRGEGIEPLALNGWGMLGAGIFLLAVSAPWEDWGEAAWTGQAIGAIAYLAIVGSAIPFVGLTILLRHLPTVAVSYISMLIPFGALGLGALIEDEVVTATAIIGASLVAAGIAVAQWPVRSPDAARP